jgi:hypothetical protein
LLNVALVECVELGWEGCDWWRGGKKILMPRLYGELGLWIWIHKSRGRPNRRVERGRGGVTSHMRRKVLKGVS